MPPYAPLAAGALNSRLTLQSLVETTDPDGTITPAWSDVDTVWGAMKVTGVAQQLESDPFAPRTAWDITVRRTGTPLPFPLRILHAGQTLFLLSPLYPDDARDQTVLRCVDGINLAIGETVTLYRGTDSENTDGSTSRSWASVATGLKLRMDEAEAALLERFFGQELAAQIHATGAIDCGIRLGDGLTVTAGRHVGQNYLVSGRKIDPRLPAQAYLALALTATTEVFV